MNRLCAIAVLLCIAALTIVGRAAPTQDRSADEIDPEENGTDDIVRVLPPPRPDEQLPAPVVPPAEAPSSMRVIELGPDLGLTSRRGDNVDYGSAFHVGAHARADVLEFLGVRLFIGHTSHEADTLSSTATFDAFQRQPPVDFLTFGGQLEPTWVARRDLKLYLAAGLSWERLTLEGFRDNFDTVYPKRTGVMVNYLFGLGSIWEVVPNWMAVTLSVTLGMSTQESGTLFDPGQAFDSAGKRQSFSGLSPVQTTLTTLLGLGVVP